MNNYRSHYCSELNISNLNKEVVLSGWVDTIRDHGNLIFIDLRDNYGITQCVVDAKHKLFNEISKLSNESVIKVKGNLGELTQDIDSSDITVNIEDNNVTLSRKSDSKEARSKHGLYRALIANMTQGVTVGHSKILELRGVG